MFLLCKVSQEEVEYSNTSTFCDQNHIVFSLLRILGRAGDTLEPFAFINCNVGLFPLGVTLSLWLVKEIVLLE